MGIGGEENREWMWLWMWMFEVHFREDDTDGVIWVEDG